MAENKILPWLTANFRNYVIPSVVPLTCSGEIFSSSYAMSPGNYPSVTCGCAMYFPMISLSTMRHRTKFRYTTGNILI